MNVEKLMSTPVVCCAPETSMAEAAKLMWDRDCGVLPVVGPDRTLEGMITDRDICMAAGLRGTPLAEIPVRDAMSRDVATACAGDSLESVQAVMRTARVHRLPILDGERRVVGVVSLSDLCRGAVASGSKPELLSVSTTLSAICERREIAITD